MKTFLIVWPDHREHMRTPEFKEEFDQVIEALRSDRYEGILEDRFGAVKYGGNHPGSAFEGKYNTEYGIRVDTDEHIYLLRCDAFRMNFYCSCYEGKRLDEHIRRAERGIRFVDYDGEDLFRIPDGEKIVVTTKLNEAIEHKCRYIDDEHVQVGSNLYHINEFEEKMHRNGAVYRPLREKAVERQEVQAGGKKNRVDSQKVR